MPPLLIRSVGGPDSGWSHSLPTGRHWIGRAPNCAVEIADPAIEAHHAILHVGAADGPSRIMQMTGRGPVSVDGAVADGWTAIAPGAVVELGHSRLRIGTVPRPTPTPRPHVHAPLDDTPHELARFKRDVGAAVAAALARGPDAAAEIVLGEGPVAVEIDVRDRAGRPVDPADLDHATHRIVERLARPVGPVTVPSQAMVGPEAPVGIVASPPIAEAVTEAIVAQLPVSDRGMVSITTADDPTDLPPHCTSVLVVGETWRATWQPDHVDRPDRIVRLHARGRASWRAQREDSPAGRSSLNR